VNVPVSKEGDLPLIKIPKISLEALKLKDLKLTGADLTLGVKLKNPNAFSMLLDNMKYSLDINGKSWVSGDASDDVQVAEKGENIIEIPISLNFLQIGRSVYKIVAGDEDLSYNFGGNLDLATSIPLLGQINLPFDRSGSIKVSR